MAIKRSTLRALPAENPWVEGTVEEKKLGKEKQQTIFPQLKFI